ncbi:hypothetical protein GCM10027048_20220 [Hymenobacter coalescens]
MLELTSAGQPIALAPGTSVQLEMNSPLFDEEVLKGTYSFSFSVPAPPNGEVYGFPELPESASVRRGGIPGELSDDGHRLLTGTQRVRTANARQYAVNLVGGLGELSAALNGRKIHTFAYGGERRVPQYVERQDAHNVTWNVPGLVLHANDVVANPRAYDYVFAPLLNDGRDGGDEPVAGTFVNAWGWPQAQEHGLPTTGTFLYDPAAGAPQHFCPLPWLRYVLASIFLELGLQVDAAQFLPGALGDLVIGSSAVLPAPIHRFRLADVLPDLTVVELLAKLKKDFGVVVLVSAARVVRTAVLGEVLASPDYVDLTHLAAAVPDLDRPEPVGVTLSYATDSEDELTKDLVRDFGGQRLGAPVVALADLPASAPVALQPGQGYAVPLAEVRLVTGLDAWYKSTVAWTFGAAQATITWAFFAHNFRPLDVQGGGEVQETGTAATLMQAVPLTFAGNTTRVLVPAMRQRVYRAGDADAKRPTALRLWFWHGLQPTTHAVVEYPLVSPFNRNAVGLRVGEYSLKLDGPDGLHERWLKAWLQLRCAPTQGKAELALSTEQLAEHDPAKKVRLAGVDYLVRSLKPNVPLTKRVPVELLRV